MKKAILAVAFLISLSIPATAIAVPVHHHIYAVKQMPDGPTVKVLTDVITYDVAPADSDQDGIANQEDNCPNTAGPNNGCPPPPPLPEPVVQEVAQEVAAPTTPAPTVPAPTGGSGCVGMSAESGADGYSAMSPTGYIGCYQISPDHFAPGGSCAGYGTDPAGQDACANTICITEGPGAWTNDAGQNPCGRLGG